MLVRVEVSRLGQNGLVNNLHEGVFIPFVVVFIFSWAAESCLRGFLMHQVGVSAQIYSRFKV